MKKTKAQLEAQELLRSLQALQEAVAQQVSTATSQLNDLLSELGDINKNVGEIVGHHSEITDNEIEDILDKHWKGFE